MIFKAGLIGYGYWGPILLRNFSSHSDVEIKIICDRNPSKLESALTISPSSQVSQNAESIFSDPDIDFVIIATQGKSHYDLVKKGLLSGKHIFVEKPFALNLEQAKELVEINKQCDLQIMVDHTFLFTPEYQVVKEIIRNQDLGKLFHFHSTRADFGRFQSDINILGHLMYHDAYILLDLFGEQKPINIKASGTAHIINPLEDTAVVSIIYPNGFNADIINNMLCPIKERKIFIAGEKAILLWDDMAINGNKLKLYNNKIVSYDSKSGNLEYPSNNSIKTLTVSSKQAIENEVDYFISCLKDGDKPKNDENAGLQVMQFLENINIAMRA
ncbi:MAG: Gfo/Idh/MocA family oxidoreductase [Nitrospina sp.]|jgi:predicted dehydrogenase|nr:Gfo/Idh/MocA family oxidoreductase [Nitrospina sp.]MBT3877195.1 Gfo/Idh/MocA family oxidoreductase [Nitrospina sp.]MBT4048086.1 Gfo/Idh/MocA family oxidoreductase [Nitrospina sp.]MBT4559208.1 Gfo/Idh/MocA family oxidoreductase [Nitrospina sp.]MBT5348109.1 Gfo/Idh/MocA family oxidoreductase [Nitrospina sp.]